MSESDSLQQNIQIVSLNCSDSNRHLQIFITKSSFATSLEPVDIPASRKQLTHTTRQNKLCWDGMMGEPYLLLSMGEPHMQ